MIFKVSEKFKGSFVLPTLKQAMWANMTLSISGNDLRADDVRDVIKKGILIPINDDYNQEEIQKDHDVIIINKTEKVLVLGKITLRPGGSLSVSKTNAQSAVIISAAEDGLVTILSDEGDESYIQRKVVEKVKTKQKSVKVINAVGESEEVENISPKKEEDESPTAVAWNFKTKTLEEAQKVPKSEGLIDITENEEGKVNFIDEEIKVTKKKTVFKKNEVKKKAIKKKTSIKKKTKKEEIQSKNKKVKVLEPVGEKKIPKTIMDAAIELDSRGNPIGDKASDILQHLIDSVDSPKEVSFVDEEQARFRHKTRIDMD